MCEHVHYMKGTVAFSCSLLAVVIFAGCPRPSPSPSTDKVLWAKRAGGPEYDQGDGVCVSSQGKIFVTGEFMGSCTFGPGEPNETTLTATLFNDAKHDIYYVIPAGFVARYNEDGTLDWATRICDADGGQEFLGVAAAEDGGCFVAGGEDEFLTRFSETGELLWTAQSQALCVDVVGLPDASCVVVTVGGFSDLALAKYTADGEEDWVTSTGATSSYISPRPDLALLPDGSILVTSDFSNTATFGEGEANETTLSLSGQENSFAAKYDNAGLLEWVIPVGGVKSTGICGNGDGSFIVCGFFGGEAVLNPDSPAPVHLISEGKSDAFVAKYTADRTLAWAKSAGGTGWDQAWSMAPAGDGSCVITGDSDATMTLGEETISCQDEGVFVARYSAEGKVEWARSAESNGTFLCHDISSFADGSSVITGQFYGETTFGTGPDPITLHHEGHGDIFLARFRP